AIAGVVCLALARSEKPAAGVLVLGMAANFCAALMVFRQKLSASIPLGGYNFSLDFRIDNLSSFIVLAAAVLGGLIAIYAAQFMQGRKYAGTFFAFLLFTMSLANGAVLADHLITLLFFWEGMMVTMYVLIAVGSASAYKTAVKAFFISGVTDLCLMAGIALVFHETHTFSMSTIAQTPIATEGLAGLAFVLMAIGATSKAGSMPFHSWIPDAAIDAPAPFMSFLPGVIEKLLGIYLLARVSLDLFKIEEHSWASTGLMTLGACTILLAVAMALVQKDYKRLLSFHAISQVGYMILGIGTGTTLGIVGGLFHMVNHAMYKGTLFLTGGAVERQAGSTDLRKIGGLAAKMPITFACFVVAALSISGVYPFNGFFSKELVYDGALERGMPYYVAASLGSFLTAASFLKLGHAAFKGAFRAPKAEVKEAPLAMLVPMICIAALCIFFGVANQIPLTHLVIPGIEQHIVASDVHMGLIPASMSLTALSALVWILAIANHAFGVKRSGSGLGASDHFHYAPVAHQLYDAAERRWFDPYEIALKVIQGISYAAYGIDRGVDYLYEGVIAGIATGFSGTLRKTHTGSHAQYLAWSMVGLAIIVAYFVGGF
ncbi:MAG TPA: proton-conducting transporter membrane subunit, partial [Anaeromyxobacteraceae bacterium]|nr:proton-conducting transporter membrane subunit [Anaeromyxobacteraceae bacterium]